MQTRMTSTSVGCFVQPPPFSCSELRELIFPPGVRTGAALRVCNCLEQDAKHTRPDCVVQLLRLAADKLPVLPCKAQLRARKSGETQVGGSCESVPWCSAVWFENVATPAQVKTIYGFPTDRVKVRDDFSSGSLLWQFRAGPARGTLQVAVNWPRC